MAGSALPPEPFVRLADGPAELITFFRLKEQELPERLLPRCLATCCLAEPPFLCCPFFSLFTCFLLREGLAAMQHSLRDEVLKGNMEGESVRLIL